MSAAAEPTPTARRAASCSVDGCRVLVLLPRRFCPVHWRLVGDALRQQIGDAYLDQDGARLQSLVERVGAAISAHERRRRSRSGA